jgi:hypothetical protein
MGFRNGKVKKDWKDRAAGRHHPSGEGAALGGAAPGGGLINAEGGGSEARYDEHVPSQ